MSGSDKEDSEMDNITQTMEDDEDNEDESNTQIVSQILNAIENEDNENIMKYTRESIHKMKNDILQNLHLQVDVLKDYNKKLKDFRYIDDLSDLKYGSYIRWINISNPEKLRLTNGGIVCDIQIYDSGIQILCKNPYNRFYQIKFDNCVIFQKLSDQEQVILDVMTYLDS